MTSPNLNRQRTLTLKGRRCLHRSDCESYHVLMFRPLSDPLQVAKDNGAKCALLPIEEKRNFLDASADIMEHAAPIFFDEPKTAAIKVQGLL